MLVVRSSQSWLLGAGAVAVIAALLLLVWKLRAGSAPPGHTAERNATPRTDVAPAPRTAPGLPGTKPEKVVETQRDDGEPEVEAPSGTDDSGEKPLAEIVVETNRALKDAGAKCMDKGNEAHRAAAEQRVTFRYTLVLGGDKASINSVEKVTSTVDVPDLEDCILQRVEEIAWDASGAPAMKKRMTGSLKLRELFRN